MELSCDVEPKMFGILYHLFRLSHRLPMSSEPLCFRGQIAGSYSPTRQLCMPAVSSASYSNTTQMFRLCMRSWKIVVRHDRVELEATAHKVKSWALTLRVTRYHLNAESPGTNTLVEEF
jgi:hypothetical protein